MLVSNGESLGCAGYPPRGVGPSEGPQPPSTNENPEGSAAHLREARAALPVKCRTLGVGGAWVPPGVPPEIPNLGARDLGGHHLTSHRSYAHGWTTSFLGARTTRAHDPATAKRPPTAGSRLDPPRPAPPPGSGRPGVVSTPVDLRSSYDSARRIVQPYFAVREGSRGTGLLVARRRETRQIRLPLRRQEVLLRRVARLAGRHQIAPGRAPAPHQRHAVIHGELARRRRTATVAAAPLRQPPSPPGARPKLARPRPFPANLGVRHLADERHGARIRPRAGAPRPPSGRDPAPARPGRGTRRSGPDTRRRTPPGTPRGARSPAPG